MKKNVLIFMLAFFVSVLTVSVFAHNNNEIQEPLYGVTFKENSIEVIVQSNGCTKQNDFRLEELRASNHTLINVIRIKPDRCRAMTRPMTIKLSVEVSQQAHYKINNNFIRNDVTSK